MGIVYSARRWFSDYLASKADRCLEYARLVAPEGYVPESDLEKRITGIEQKNKELSAKNSELEDKSRTYEESVEEMRQDFVKYFRMMGLDRERLENISDEDLLKRTVSRYKGLVKQLKSTVSKLSRGETEDLVSTVMLNFSHDIFEYIDFNLLYTSTEGIVHLRSKGAEREGYKGMKISDIFSQKDTEVIKAKMRNDEVFESMYETKKDGSFVRVKGIPFILSEKALSYMIQIGELE